MGGWPRPGHDAWEAFMEMEQQRLQEHAQGKMALALGYALPGESQQELDRIASEDQRLAQQGILMLKSGRKQLPEATSDFQLLRIPLPRTPLNRRYDWGL